MRRTWRWWLLVSLLVLALGAIGAALPLTGLYRAKGCLDLPRPVREVSLGLEQADTVRFAALGDTGTGDANQQAVAAALARICASQGCDFVVLLGDMFYPAGLTGPDDPAVGRLWAAPYAALDVPMLPVVGNHDLKGDVFALPALSLRHERWHMPNFRYSLRAGPAQFHAINSNCLFYQYPALFRRLRHGAANPERPWQFVLAHHPLYATSQQDDADPIVRWYWNRTLRGKVDVYLSGHSHELEHLRMSHDPAEFIVSGAGGENNLEPRRRRESPAETRFLHRGNGFAWFEVRRDALRMRFYDATGSILYEHARQAP